MCCVCALGHVARLAIAVLKPLAGGAFYPGVMAMGPGGAGRHEKTAIVMCRTTAVGSIGKKIIYSRTAHDHRDADDGGTVTKRSMEQTKIQHNEGAKVAAGASSGSGLGMPSPMLTSPPSLTGNEIAKRQIVTVSAMLQTGEGGMMEAGEREALRYPP